MNQRTSLDLARLSRLLAAYGADPRRWPEAEREPALALLAGSAEAQRLRAEAAELDLWLDQAAPPPPSPELMADVLAAASPSPWRQWLGTVWPFGPIWKPASALALAATLGIFVGLLVPAQGFVDGTQTTAEIDSLLFDPSVGMWSL